MEFESGGDVALVTRAIQGDHMAFEALVTKYRDKLYRSVFWMLRHEEDTLDVLQETFLRAYRALPHLNKPEIFSTWILRIAMNLAVNHIKKKERLRKCREKMARNWREKWEQTPDDIIECRETMEKLDALIAELPPKQKTVFILSDIEGYSYKEIAEIVNCRVGTVMSRLYYARNFLRNCLELCEDMKSGEILNSSLYKHVMEEDWATGQRRSKGKAI